ncbi:BREX-2 system adenine-specific DNA-methyltransferase PglX, partial [Pseudonocardia sp. KRD-184]|uniref:BREX-2 system adenine-specific DNA-methyltransferase PglX n=1 Tax=Pseudonocardia oceani TaxID=2792013 RepID=UPI001C49EE04
MIDSAALLKDLKGQLRLLVADLRARAEDSGDAWGTRLKEEYAEARTRERTGHSWVVWRDNEVDQAAVAWIIATTFLRFCEDNDLLTGAHLNGRPTPIGWITGPGDRTALAEENLTAYFRANPTHNRRHWLQQGFAVLAAQPAGKALIDRKHNPVWTALIRPESAAALVEFWRRTDDAGVLIHDFTDLDLGTRFLGDLYQDLSEHAKKTYALLQTPDFVEEFILDQTLTPALKEFGHDGLKLIDPTCGSGHFLLGAFHRLMKVWEHEAPALDVKERVRRAMDSIHGVDLNPFAVAIARFRLTVAGINAIGERSLAAIPALGYHLAIGDALLGESGGVPATIPGIDDDEDPDVERTYLYDTEDLADYVGILQPGQYHVVVGNPPYITVKDAVLSALYRDSYKTAHRQYALSVPFAELFYRLAVKGNRNEPAGYVGQITSNSFVKREFGKKLIEDLFGGFHLDNPVDLVQVIDTSGAYVPGHGTPTVILVGRRRKPVGDVVRVVMGIRGEPGQPKVPGNGLVWTEIVENLDNPEFNGKYVSVGDLPRAVLVSHPWSLSGGGAADLLQLLDGQAARISQREIVVGRTTHTGLDEAFYRPTGYAGRRNLVEFVPVILGDEVRDYRIGGETETLFPYSSDGFAVGPSGEFLREMWTYRSPLRRRVDFGHEPEERGLRWFDHSMFFADRFRSRLSVAFAFVATHNHFVLDRGGKVFKQSAPVIKLPKGASEDQHLELLGVLNSSTACFWLKQVSHNKGEGGGARVDAGYAAMGSEEWRNTFEFTGTKLEQFPLPAELPLVRGRELDTLARELDQNSPRAVVADWLQDGMSPSTSLDQRLKEGGAAWERLRERMIFEQEELDWEVYRLYGLLDDDLAYSGDEAERLVLGQRAFEIVVARQVETGEEESTWFTRHGSVPITEPPTV